MENNLRSGAQGNSGVVLGALLILAGMFYLLFNVGPVDVGPYEWPLFVIVPGLALIGSLVLVTGLILAVQNALGVWATWSYAWPLVFPGAVGLGVAIIGAERRDRNRVERGLWMVATGITLATIFGIFFEGLLHVSGVALAPAFGIVMPVFLIAFGFALLAATVLSRRDHRAG